MSRNTAAYAIPLSAVGILTFAAVVLSGGDLATALAPVAAAVLLYAALVVPLRVCVLALMFLALVADAPQDNPMGGLWESPLYGLGQLLCNNWSGTFGIRALSFSGMDVLAFLLVARTAVSPRSRPLAAPLRYAMWAFIGAIAFLAVVGLVRGGEMDPAYWQVRQLGYLPVFAWLLSQALDRPRDHLLLAPLVLSAALIKTAVGLYFHFAVARPEGLISPVILSHSETMLLCLSATLVAVRWLENPDARSLRRCLWFLPTMLLVIWLNNRRIAYIGLAGVAMVVWKFTRWNLAKQAVARAAVLAIPLFGIYAAAGWSSDAPAFKPIAAIRTIVSPRNVAEAGADSSTRAREIENYNLSQTARQHPLGTGLGHGYEEVVQGPDISTDFSLYRYIPHNSVLWMMATGGPLGFFLLWSLFIVGIYLAARAHRLAGTPVERMSALGSICAQLLFLIQAWGDMGTQNWSTTWLAAAALAVAGKLALSTGAWPSRFALLEDRMSALFNALEASWKPQP